MTPYTIQFLQAISFSSFKEKILSPLKSPKTFDDDGDDDDDGDGDELTLQ